MNNPQARHQAKQQAKQQRINQITDPLNDLLCTHSEVWEKGLPVIEKRDLFRQIEAIAKKSEMKPPRLILHSLVARHLNSEAYLMGLTINAPRFNLDGSEGGTVAKNAVDVAGRLLRQMQRIKEMNEVITTPIRLLG